MNNRRRVTRAWRWTQITVRVKDRIVTSRRGHINIDFVINCERFQALFLMVIYVAFMFILSIWIVLNLKYVIGFQQVGYLGCVNTLKCMRCEDGSHITTHLPYCKPKGFFYHLIKRSVTWFVLKCTMLLPDECLLSAVLILCVNTCRPACPSALFHTWETLLQEVEIDSQAQSDIAFILGRQVSGPLLERSFHRKIQSRKVFTHRQSYETILTKTEEKLAKVQRARMDWLLTQGKPRDSRLPVLTTAVICRNTLISLSYEWVLSFVRKVYTLLERNPFLTHGLIAYCKVQLKRNFDTFQSAETVHIVGRDITSWNKRELSFTLDISSISV
jgi:hypothetical protein